MWVKDLNLMNDHGLVGKIHNGLGHSQSQRPKPGPKPAWPADCQQFQSIKHKLTCSVLVTDDSEKTDGWTYDPCPKVLEGHYESQTRAQKNRSSLKERLQHQNGPTKPTRHRFHQNTTHTRNFHGLHLPDINLPSTSI